MPNVCSEFSPGNVVVFFALAFSLGYPLWERGWRGPCPYVSANFCVRFRPIALVGIRYVVEVQPKLYTTIRHLRISPTRFQLIALQLIH
jgi:hypothetical protein